MKRSILRSKTITTTTHVVKIEFGLSYHSGNKDAYFFITADGKKKSKNGRLVDDWGGAAHDEIKKLTPIFNDLIELHLSDEDGAPMHATANALFCRTGFENCPIHQARRNRRNGTKSHTASFFPPSPRAHR